MLMLTVVPTAMPLQSRTLTAAYLCQLGDMHQAASRPRDLSSTATQSAGQLVKTFPVAPPRHVHQRSTSTAALQQLNGAHQPAPGRNKARQRVVGARHASAGSRDCPSRHALAGLPPSGARGDVPPHVQRLLLLTASLCRPQTQPLGPGRSCPAVPAHRWGPGPGRLLYCSKLGIESFLPAAWGANGAYRSNSSTAMGLGNSHLQVPQSEFWVTRTCRCHRANPSHRTPHTGSSKCFGAAADRPRPTHDMYSRSSPRATHLGNDRGVAQQHQPHVHARHEPVCTAVRTA